MLITQLLKGNIVEALCCAAAILLALMFHELSHAYVAYLFGDTTAQQYGRLSLNPLKHLDPWGTLMIVLVGFGWAKSVPINPFRFRKFKLGTIAVSLAGPFANFILAFISLILLTFTLGISIVTSLFVYLIIINIGLGVFNLIPIPPWTGQRCCSHCCRGRRMSSF